MIKITLEMVCIKPFKSKSCNALTVASGSIGDEVVIRRATAYVGSLSIDALSVLTGLWRFALVHVGAVEAGHYCK